MQLCGLELELHDSLCQFSTVSCRADGLTQEIGACLVLVSCGLTGETTLSQMRRRLLLQLLLRRLRMLGDADFRRPILLLQLLEGNPLVIEQVYTGPIQMT